MEKVYVLTSKLDGIELGKKVYSDKKSADMQAEDYLDTIEKSLQYWHAQECAEGKETVVRFGNTVALLSKEDTERNAIYTYNVVEFPIK